jgi:hypothetical protein
LVSAFARAQRARVALFNERLVMVVEVDLDRVALGCHVTFAHRRP